MKSLVFGVLSATILCLGSAPAFAAPKHFPTRSELEAAGYSCSVHGLSVTCSRSVNGATDLPDIVISVPIYSTGPVAAGYGACGPGYWSSPAPGICNIAISDDMNHGRDATIKDGGSAPYCDIASATFSLFPPFFKEGAPQHLNSKCLPAHLF